MATTVYMASISHVFDQTKVDISESVFCLYGLDQPRV